MIITITIMISLKPCHFSVAVSFQPLFFLPPSIVKYTLIQLSEVEQRGLNEMTQVAQQVNSNHGLLD